MTPHFVSLLTHPERAWVRIRNEERANSSHYLGHLLLLAAIPAICLFVGTTMTGWTLVENETVRLDSGSAAQLSILLYLSSLFGVFLMGAFVRWMTRTFDARPTLNQCIGFVAYMVTPLFLAGLAGLYPSRWLAVIVLPIAAAYSAYLLFIGLPKFMRIPREKGMLFSASALGVGILLLVHTLVSMILFWMLMLQPEYERSAPDQAYPTVQERSGEVPKGL
jgi:hypothetical protein